MLKIILLVALFFITINCQVRNSLWPLPQTYTGSNTTQYVYDYSNFNFKATSYSNDVLNRAFIRMRERIFWKKINKPNKPGSSAAVNVRLCNVEVKAGGQNIIQYGVDESYTITTGAVPLISANTVWGALRGLQTFTQIVRYQDNAYVSDDWKISDSPRFKWRGLLLDTSRHYLPVQSILTQLELMEQSKLNVFHWHIVDGQSFPFQSVKYPLLSGKGAFTPEEVYTHADVTKIVDFANDRGIRVVPEFDMPAHASSWSFGYPEIGCSCEKYQGQCNFTYPQPRNFGDACNDTPLNPAKNETYSLIDGLLGEVAALFPDEYLHMGGDELAYRVLCWDTPEILQFMKDNNLGNFTQLEAYFTYRTQAIAKKYNKLIIYWQNIFNNGITITPSGIVQVWKDHTTLDQVAKAEHFATLSFGWYLDDLSASWQDMYNNEPFDGKLTPAQESYILGGEACMWGESVDETNITPRIFPRACAVAERLWSAQSVTDINFAQLRLHDHRCKQKFLGFQVEPIDIGYCY